MKIRKLTIAALLTMGLVLTGCFNKKSESSNPASDSSSGSQVQPVSTIDIVRLTRALAVGETVNLDEHVNVVGGEGPKAFTASIKVGEGVVSLEGKTLTAIGEGDFRLEIAAGEQTANFSGSVLSALKFAFQAVLDQTANGYGLQEWDYDLEGNVVVDPTKIQMRQSDYEAEPYAHKDGEGKYTIPGGMLKAQNGKTYEFKMDDMQGTNFEVLPDIISDFGNYYCNQDIPFTAADTETLKTDQGEFLMIDSTAPAVLGDSRSANLVDDANVVLFGNFLKSTATYYSGVVGPLVVTPLTVGEGNEAFDTFDISIYITIGETPYLMNSSLLLVGAKTPTLAAARNYIDSGANPEPISYAEIVAKVNAAVAAKNYRVTIENGFFDSDSDSLAFVDYMTAFNGYHPSWEEVYPDAVEERIVTSTGVYYDFNQTQHYDPSTYDQHASPVTVHEIGGLMNHDGGVYQYEKTGESTYDTAAVTGATDLWTSLGAYLATGLVPGESFAVSSREEKDGKVYFELDQATASAFYPILCRQSSNGSFIKNVQDQQYGQGTLEPYITVYVTVSDNAIEYFWHVRFSNQYLFAQKLTFSAIDAGNVLPVTEDEIFPIA